jgi:hypothetical protein
MFRFAKHALLPVTSWNPTKNRKRVVALLLAATCLTTLFGFAAQAGQGPSQWCSDNVGYEEHIINSPATFNVEAGGPVGPQGWSWIICASPTPWGDGSSAPTGGAAWFNVNPGSSGSSAWVGCASDSTVLSFGCDNYQSADLSSPTSPAAFLTINNGVNVAGMQINVPSVQAGTGCESAVVAISISSCANGGLVGISATGNASASGYPGITSQGIALSGLGCANAPQENGSVAVSSGYNHCASVGSIAVSGMGDTGANLVGVSGTGNSYATVLAAVSGTGYAGPAAGMPLMTLSGTGDSYGNLLAVSGLGNATTTGYSVAGITYPGIAVSGVGCATSNQWQGSAAISSGYNHCASTGSIAVSGMGDTAADLIGISGTGTSYVSNIAAVSILGDSVPAAASPYLAISGLGRADARWLAISGTGSSTSWGYGTLPGAIAVSGAGPANGNTGSPYGVGVSGAGDSYGNVGAVSGVGNANGGQVAVSTLGNASTGDGSSQASLLNVSGGAGATSINGTTVGINTGISTIPTAEQAIDATYEPPVDLWAAKEAAMEAIAPYVAYNLATGITDPSSSEPAPFSTMSSSSQLKQSAKQAVRQCTAVCSRMAYVMCSSRDPHDTYANKRL